MGACDGKLLLFAVFITIVGKVLAVAAVAFARKTAKTSPTIMGK